MQNAEHRGGWNDRTPGLEVVARLHCKAVSKRALTFDLDRGNGGLDAPEIEQVVDRWRIALPLFPCRVHANRSGTRAIDPEPHRGRVVVDAPSQLEDRHDAPYRGEKARVRVERARGDGPAVGLEDLHVADLQGWQTSAWRSVTRGGSYMRYLGEKHFEGFLRVLHHGSRSAVISPAHGMFEMIQLNHRGFGTGPGLRSL